MGVWYRKIVGAAAVCAALVCFAVPAYAGPAYPGAVTATQADGTQLEVYLHGDENFNYVTDADGYLLRRNNSGDYVYEQSTGFGRYAGPSLAAPDAESRPRSAVHMSTLEEPRPGRQSVWPASSVTAAESRPLLMILVEFSDMKLDSRFGAEYWYDKIFSCTAERSINRYYGEMSGGMFQYTPAVESAGTGNDGIVTVTLSAQHPQPELVSDDPAQYGMLIQQLASDALYAADRAGDIDFASYDTNNDGYITTDELIVGYIVAGYEASGTADMRYSVWAQQWHAYQMGVECDGKKLLRYEYGSDGSMKIGNYIMQGQLFGSFGTDYYGWNGTLPLPDSRKLSQSIQIGTLCHELGHTIGLPDLYNTVEQLNGVYYIEPSVGYLSLMASGNWGFKQGQAPGSSPAYLDPWSRIRLGWLEPTEVQPGSAEVYEASSFASGNYQVYQIPTTDTNEYFLVENRQFQGFDAGLSIAIDNGGLAIWHVDNDIIHKYESNIKTSNELNSHYPEQGIMLAACGFAPYTGTLDNDENYTRDPDWIRARGAASDPLWYRAEGRYNAFALGSVPTSRCNVRPAASIGSTSSLDAPRADSGVRLEVLTESGEKMKFTLQNSDLDMIASRDGTGAMLKIANNTTAVLDQTVTPFVAAYNADGTLLAVQVQETMRITAPAGGMSEEITFSNLPAGDGIYYTFFVWDSIDSMRPLVSPLTVK